jgi:hypothetical protein
MKMSEKSHVSMEQKMCPVCGKVEDSGSILLDRRLKQSMEQHTVTGYALCKLHQKLKDEGYMFLVVCDETKSNINSNNIKMEDAYRTGEIIQIKRDVFSKMFTVPIDDVRDFVFCSTELRDKLKEVVEK